MQPAWQCLPRDLAPTAAADLVILTPCAATRARLAAAARARAWPRVDVHDLSRLGEPGFARLISAARGVLIDGASDAAHRDDVQRLAALLAPRGVALALLDDDDVDDALIALNNLPPSTVRRMRALLASDRANAATALLTQFALAAGLAAEAGQ